MRRKINFTAGLKMISNRHLTILMVVLVVIILGITVGAFPVQAQEISLSNGFNPQELLRQTLQWVDNLGAIAGLAFVCIYIVATIAFFPGSVLTLGAGVLFGIVRGSLYVFVGATIGGTFAFLVGRYLARGWVLEKIAENQKFKAIDLAVGQAGFKIVLLARLSPIFPFNLLNYAMGITGVSIKDYVLASLGIIPGTVMYVYLGSLAGNLATIGEETDVNPVAQWSIRIIGFVATLAVTVYVTKIARQALNKSLDNYSS